MSRRRFLRNLAVLGATVASARAPQPMAQSRGSTAGPTRIIMGGYGPATTGFSLALKRIGDRLSSRFGSDIDVHYVYNIMDLGYRADDILWLVEQGVLTLGYQSSSYLGERVPDIAVADLPFLFADRP
jgi:TRAP-type C4-dicarboxylate transport system substrate-binding protein